MTQKVGAAEYFETLGGIIDKFGLTAMNDMVDFAQGQWDLGRPGPVVRSGEGITPPFALTLGAETISFRVGVEGGKEGSLPTTAFLGIVAAKNAAASQGQL